MTDLETLSKFAKALAVAVNHGEDIWDTAFEITDWAQDRGLVSQWSVYRRRGGDLVLMGSWCIPDDENVMDYVAVMDCDEWEILFGDDLLIHRNTSPPDEPWHIIPIREDLLDEPCVNWKQEGF